MTEQTLEQYLIRTDIEGYKYLPYQIKKLIEQNNYIIDKVLFAPAYNMQRNLEFAAQLQADAEQKTKGLELITKSIAVSIENSEIFEGVDYGLMDMSSLFQSSNSFGSYNYKSDNFDMKEFIQSALCTVQNLLENRKKEFLQGIEQALPVYRILSDTSDYELTYIDMKETLANDAYWQASITSNPNELTMNCEGYEEQLEVVYF